VKVYTKLSAILNNADRSQQFPAIFYNKE